MGQKITVVLSEKWTVVRTCDECERAKHAVGRGLRASCTRCQDLGYLVRAYPTREALEAALVALDETASVTSP